MPSPRSETAKRTFSRTEQHGNVDRRAGRRVLDRVVDQVAEHLQQAGPVGADDGGAVQGEVEGCLGEPQAGRLDRLGGERVCLHAIEAEGQRVRVELTGGQDVLDDARQPAGLGRDHVQQDVALLLVELDVGAAQGHRGAVDAGERRAQLVRHGRDEVALQLLDLALGGQVAKGEDGARVEADANDREPQVAAADPQRQNLPRRRLAGGVDWGDARSKRLPAGDRVGRQLADHLLGGEAGDRLGGRVPEADGTGRVDEDDAVADEGERLRRLRALGDLAVQARVVDCDRRPPGELLGEGDVGGAVDALRLRGREREHADRAPAGDQRHEQVRAEVEAAQELSLTPRRRHLVDPLGRDVRDEVIDALAQHLRGSLGAVELRRVARPDLVRDGLPGGIGADDGDAPDRPVVGEQVDHAPVRQLGHGEAGDARERGLVVERRREQRRRLDEKPLLALLADAVGDVAEEPDAAGVTPVVEGDRRAVAGERAAVEQPDLVPARLLRVAVQVLDALDELVRVAELVAHERQRGIVRAGRQDVVGDAPDLGEAAVGEQDAAVGGDNEDAVEKRLGLRAEQRALERGVEPGRALPRALVCQHAGTVTPHPVGCGLFRRC